MDRFSEENLSYISGLRGPGVGIVYRNNIAIYAEAVENFAAFVDKVRRGEELDFSAMDEMLIPIPEKTFDVRLAAIVSQDFENAKAEWNRFCGGCFPAYNLPTYIRHMYRLRLNIKHLGPGEIDFTNDMSEKAFVLLNEFYSIAFHHDRCFFASMYRKFCDFESFCAAVKEIEAAKGFERLGIYIDS